MGNFFILEANALKMFTDNLAKVHNIHRVELPFELLLCQCHCSVLTCECVWSTRISLLCCNILTRVGTAARNVFFIYLFDVIFSPGCSSKSFKLYSPKEPPNGSTFPPFHPGTMLDRDVGWVLLSSLEEGLLF